MMTLPSDQCYVCQGVLLPPHDFYPGLCRPCGDLNYQRRMEQTDLRGYSALVTGGRIKIGFETALRLLRGGAKVFVTTRFADDARERFKKVKDYSQWEERLFIYPSDFRFPASIENVIERICSDCERLDILINNAAQTIRRPPAFYHHLLSNVSDLPSAMPRQSLMVPWQLSTLPRTSVLRNFDESSVAVLSQLELIPGDSIITDGVFPSGVLDKDGQQEDRRDKNSWMLTLSEVHPVEFFEVLFINVIAPFLLCSRLRSIMRQTDGTRRSFIVNVSAMEGNFYDPEKNTRHPHTNMAKAALNMMTRTCGRDFASDGILMTSVDPGWVTNEKPFPLSEERSGHRFEMAIDAIDGAARVCDPIVRFVNDSVEMSGVLLKNYGTHPW